MNRLYYGDCLTIMQDMPAASVDLIYLDPPFNSNRTYNAIYRDETGRPLPDQIEAFCDMWTLDSEREEAIRLMPVLMREQGYADSTVEFWRLWMNALRDTQPRLLAYLSYMTERLMQMRSIIKPTGSIYLHCDQTASHYIKVMMDAIFGHQYFCNEITWQRTNRGHKGSQFAPRSYPTQTDTLLFYTRHRRHTFNIDDALLPYEEGYEDKTYNRTDEKGSYKRESPFRRRSAGARPNLCYTYKGITAPVPTGWTVSLERLKQMDADGELEFVREKVYRKIRPRGGRRVSSLWLFDDIGGTRGKERMEYDTQKPLALLKRIITISSNPGDVVLDPFCGCATTLEAAHRLGRRWIGIDIAIHAIKRVAKMRLEERLGLVQGKDFTVEGVPRTVEGAQDLWERDKYHFQKWAVESVDGFVTTKRSADGGVDGRVYFAL